MRPLLLLPLALMACDVFSQEDESADISWADSGGYYTPEFEYSSDALTSRGSVWTQSRGVAPYGRAENVWVGMGTVVCQAEFTTGYINADVDPDSGDEQLTDWDDNSVIGVTRNRVFQMGIDGSVERTDRIPGVVDAQLYDGGIVYVVHDDESGDCEIGVDGDNGSNAADVPTSVCRDPDAVSVDKPNGNAYATSASGTKVVGEGAISDHPAQGDLSAVDSARGLLYVAKASLGIVEAWSMTGELQWSSAVGGNIQRMRANERRGSVIVLANINGARTLVELAAADGAQASLLTTSQEVLDLELSDRGDRLTLSTDELVQFFEFNP